MKDTSNIIVVFFMAMIVMTFLGCFGEQGVLTKAERKYVDSVTLAQTKIIRADIDSICDADFQKNVDLAVDSILQQRVREIKAILEK